MQDQEIKDMLEQEIEKLNEKVEEEMLKQCCDKSEKTYYKVYDQIIEIINPFLEGDSFSEQLGCESALRSVSSYMSEKINIDIVKEL